ncbi:hypothetical protein KC331_g19191 [Hortaea werneckii]|uniref:Uncharacterized protein n=1 Tax=Hortaea werneckii TaxID=91943 RepID=A0A3M7BSZ9_HORWE|nr:hypothetical protein KC331_g19191 [Hortaea werneckii]RMY42650.1 hypothetical protein D0865_11807 [Hortaea werneckii]
MEATGTSDNSSFRDEASQDTYLKGIMTESVTTPESASTTTVMRNKNNNDSPQTQRPSLATLQEPRTSTEDPPPAYSAQPDHKLNGHIKPHHNHGNKSYKGFPTQEAYLAALHEWAETQKYLPVGDNGVEGFYGTTTLEEYARKEPKVEVGFGSALRRKMGWRRRKEGEGG